VSSAAVPASVQGRPRTGRKSAPAVPARAIA